MSLNSTVNPIDTATDCASRGSKGFSNTICKDIQRQNQHPIDHHVMHTIYTHVPLQKKSRTHKGKPWKLFWGSPEIEAQIYTNTEFKKFLQVQC